MRPGCPSKLAGLRKAGRRRQHTKAASSAGNKKPRGGSLRSARPARRMTLGAPSPPGASVSLPTLQKRFSGQAARLASGALHGHFPTSEECAAPGSDNPRALPDRVDRGPQPERRGSARGERAGSDPIPGREAARAPRPHRPDPSLPSGGA